MANPTRRPMVHLIFDEPERAAALSLISLALAEDFGERGDLTTQSLIAAEQSAEVRVVARKAGVLAGSPVAELVFEKLDASVEWRTRLSDGCALEPGSIVATVAGPLRFVLAGERTALNFLTHLSGIASLTRTFVELVAGTGAKIFDTRKTLPGWRVLEKYAVRAGGGTNHRMGLFDAVLIKDNHLAAWRESTGTSTIAEAIHKVRACLKPDVPLEVEVDTLDQLADAFDGSPDAVLLDNMDVGTLRQAVLLRDRRARHVELEASGGVTLENVNAIAQTGVDRISIGALTHSAKALDLAFDWNG